MRNTRLAPVFFWCHWHHKAVTVVTGGIRTPQAIHPAPVSKLIEAHLFLLLIPPPSPPNCTNAHLPGREDRGPNASKQTMHRCGTGRGATAVTPYQLAFKGVSRISESDLESLLHGAAKGLGLMAKGKCAAPITQMSAQWGSCPSLSCLQSAANEQRFPKVLVSFFFCFRLLV